jgi:hypothetical protein
VDFFSLLLEEPQVACRTKDVLMLVTQLWPGIQLDESFPNGQDSSLRAVVDLQLMENVSHMILDGLFAQVQVIGDFLVRLAIRDQA